MAAALPLRSSIRRGDQMDAPRERRKGWGADRGHYAKKNISAGGFLRIFVLVYLPSNVSGSSNPDRTVRNQPTRDGIWFAVHPVCPLFPRRGRASSPSPSPAPAASSVASAAVRIQDLELISHARSCRGFGGTAFDGFKPRAGAAHGTRGLRAAAAVQTDTVRDSSR